MQSLILDLRSNPGGRLSAACGIANLFLPGGDIVLTQARIGPPRRRVASSEGTLPDFPLLVLVNQESASASEVLGGALQDHQRALIVGTRTWGKGSVQELFPLDSGRMALKLTTKRYLTPNGRSLHREPGARVWGILPDVYLELQEEEWQAILQSWAEAEIIHGRPETRPEVPPHPDDRQLQVAVEILQGQTVYADPVTGK
jgi:carboxyl-terminal processing protease